MKKFFKIFFAISIFATLIFVSDVSAANLKDAFKSDSGSLNQVVGGAGYDIAEGNKGINPIISNVVKVSLSILGIVFLLLLIYGGYTWMTAQGDESKVTKSKNTMLAAVTGLIIVVSAYAISVFVIEKLASQSLQQTTQIDPDP